MSANVRCRRRRAAAAVLLAIVGALAPASATWAQDADADPAGADAGADPGVDAGADPADEDGEAGPDEDGAAGAAVAAVVGRYGAEDRYATSLLIAETFAKRAGGTVDNVVLVSGEHWHDAAVATAMASALRAPLAMTPPEGLRAGTTSMLSIVRAKHVIIVATGTWPDTTVSPRVHSQLGVTRARVFLTSGADRYLTGVEVARWLNRLPGRAADPAPVILANGDSFADALAAGPLSYLLEAPLLLTPGTELHPDVAQYLRDADIGHVVLMGGTAALSADVETAVRDLGVARVDRIEGATRYHTAVAAARYTAERLAGVCFGGLRIGLARGDVPADAASAAPLLAQQCTPLLLTGPDRLPEPTAEHLSSLRNAVPTIPLTITVFGGPDAIPDQLLDPLTADPDPQGDRDSDADPDNGVDDGSDADADTG